MKRSEADEAEQRRTKRIQEDAKKSKTKTTKMALWVV
jgi:hypothetical protein